MATTTPPTTSTSQLRPKRAPRMASGGAIREAAAALFLEKGYQATSMDDIAAAAQVSKQTIYTHFASKEDLFANLVLGNADRAEGFARAAVDAFDAFAPGADLESALGQLARTYLRFVIRPEVLRLRRLVIGEAGRFPDLAAQYYERVPQRMYGALADLLRRLSAEGRLSVPDPELAAHHLAWLLLGWPLDRGMFYEGEAAIRGVDLDRAADEAVRVFLAAYRAS